jgi:anti-anti-sigma factor
MPQPLEIEITAEHATCLLRVAGEVDLATAPQLAAELAKIDGDVLVDLAAVTLLDSSGIGALVHAWKDLAASGRTLRTRSEQDIVWRTMQVSGVAHLLNPDRDE